MRALIYLRGLPDIRLDSSLYRPKGIEETIPSENFLMPTKQFQVLNGFEVWVEFDRGINYCIAKLNIKLDNVFHGQFVPTYVHSHLIRS